MAKRTSNKTKVDPKQQGEERQRQEGEEREKPIAVVLFAGGGGVEAGMLAAGIEPILAVECDPEKPDVSGALADSHETNFPRCKVLRRTVKSCADEDFEGFPQEPDILWASPVCSNFSVAKNGKEQRSDIEAASAVIKAIKKLKPKHFFLENVPAYQKSVSWKEIELILPTIGYRVASFIIDMSDYGVPQARVRFIARACREGKPLPLPEKQPKIGWYDAIADLIPGLPESQLLKGQQESVDKFLSTNDPEPLFIDRAGGRGRYRAVPSSKPANTIMRSHFTDGKNANRTKFADIWLPDGTVKSVSIECMARLQSFPDWYQLPNRVAIAGSILGYSVPPKFVEQLVKPLTLHVKREEHHKVALDEIAVSAEEMGCDGAMPTVEYGGNGNHAHLPQTERKSDEQCTPDEVISSEKMQSVNLGKVFNGSAVPCPALALPLLSSKDFIKCKDDAFCYKFLKLDPANSAAIGHWEGSRFSVPYGSLSICHLYDSTGSPPQTIAYSTALKALKRNRTDEFELELVGSPDSPNDLPDSTEFWVTVAASHERPDLMPPNLCYLFPASSFWNRGRAKVKGFPRAPQFPEGARAAADSGGFVASFKWGGKYPYTPAEYVEWLNTWNPEWAATMDLCCEEPLTSGSKAIIHDRQDKTTNNARHLWREYGDRPWMWVPTIQGWDTEDYVRHAIALKPLLEEMRAYYGEKFKVGIGTLCARASNKQIKEIVEAVSGVLPGFKFHLWGVKLDAAGLLTLPVVASFDSAAWDGLAGARSRQVWQDEYKDRMTQREYCYNVALPKYLASLEAKGIKITGYSASEDKSDNSALQLGSVTALSIAEIRRDGGTQPREKLDLAHVAVLKEAVEDGAFLEPVIVFYDGESYWLADGFHRCKATEEAGFEDIQCIIHQGTRRDAILYSVGANAEHKAAKPRSRADKRRAVMMLLNDPEWSQWSDREIARQCKVSKTFISNQRKSLTGNVASETLRTYTTKHGTTATMQVGNIGNANKGEESEASASDDKGNGNGINRPANRWYGGKWRIGKWIASHFPEHKIYVEPFGGMWSVGLQKPQSEVEIYNDIHPGATNFWTRLKEDSERLIQDIDAIQWNDQTVEWAKEMMTTDPFESAVKFYIQCRISYAGGGTGWGSGYSPKTFDRKEHSDHSHLIAIAKRIKNLQIYGEDALDIIREFDSPDTLFYCDPPYLESTRNSHTPYEYEFDRHEELIALLGSIQGKAIISGYPSFKYASLLSSWSRKDTQGMTTSRKDATECIWIKPAKPAISPDDYVIAFLSNLDSIKTDLLREARSRIDTKLNREVDLNETVKAVVENADRFSADEVRLMIEVLKTHQAD